MFPIDRRLKSLLLGATLAICVALPAQADDIEIYQSHPSAAARPNVLFIMDTSGSMDTEVEESVPAYDPSKIYPGSCDPTRIYYSRNSDEPPTCGTTRWFRRTDNKCAASFAALTDPVDNGDGTVTPGGGGVWPAFGNPRTNLGMYLRGGRNNTYDWRPLSGGASANVECPADNGIHGAAANDGKPYAYSGGWRATQTQIWPISGDTYRLYTGNYLNYKYGPTAPEPMTRLQIVRDVAISLASSLQNVNLGLMRYSSDAQGGYIIDPVDDIAVNRDTIINDLKKFDPDDGNGGTPLSETLYEAALYLQGKNWDYGSRSSPAHSSSAAVSDGKYKSPIQYSCQKNYIVYLTDGAPTVDDDANGKIEGMIGKSCQAQVEPFHDNGWTPGSGICMDELAAWMADTKNTDLNPSVEGNQNALTYMIGFGSSIQASVPYLEAIAQAGGTGHAYTAADVPTLTNALQSIFSDIQEDSGTFVTPSIAVNAFNRAQAENDLYFSLFKVGKTAHWQGNLKKYMLKDNEIVDANGAKAVGADGFFADGTTSFWSPTSDGADVTRGGAVSQLPQPTSRNLYTSIAGNDLTLAGNAVSDSNPGMNDALVGVGSSTTSCSDACKAAINWARGVDVNDHDNDKDFSEQFAFMGDPIHGRPAVVSYGTTSTTPSESDTVVFVPTNDGFLHAITGPNAGGGKELWAFIPPELLPRLGTLRQMTKANHTYGLDGDIRVLKLDINQNGVVDGNDRVWIFFGMRAGGDHYYALDVTNRTKPRLLWNIGPDELPGVGQTWSAPVVTRVKVGGSESNTDPEKFVLIFGGGYDTTQESQPYSTDTRGNRIYMVEAQTGKLLWYAGGDGIGTPDLLLNAPGREMNNSIPARVTVIDTNGDGFADRMYAGDMGGRIWRFDIYNGKSRSQLVTGGVFAKLGNGGMPSPTPENNRRFYNAPDVALYQQRGIDPFYNIAIGSGYRGHPLNTATQERFYSVRDPMPYAQLTQAQYDSLTPILDSDLVDITPDPSGIDVSPNAKGWKLSMNLHGGWKGEKVLSESTTVNNVILFTTFEPTLDAVGPCFPSSINRVYALSLFAGKPALNFNDIDQKLDNSDISMDLKQEGIVGDVNVAVLHKGDDDEEGGGLSPTVCLAGMEIMKKCVSVGGTVRTFWSRSDAH